ncbi:peptidyl-prolyl cis-trans isomerase cyp11 [Acyrthosiphon pisum]|uniref:peptidylprolyl isomerase n=1 Tax=Acyrthosiphon pisum TaxID=7029 RepID=A0A8R1W2C8_ACYPI|nr:peptidyl-prolyl cis-trans isomerase cyp11 [Acyrthosiphon pisum]|eukprot:XP_001949110.1 PREDICTED: peptidyl-prolyl cis-trans isomerase cyp11 [Acyrthosiphon pisum]
MGVDTELVKTHVRPRCFMDVAVDNIILGRIVFELFDDFCPLTCENFRALCTGEKGLGKTTGKPLHFQGVIFHRVVKSFMVQCGDFSTGNGTGGESIFGGTFPDENFDLKHDQPFLLSMANRGPDTNGSQFFITTQPTPHLDGIHVVFGRVVSGQPVVMQIEELGVDKNSRPLQDAKVVKCGELILKSKIKQSEKSASDSETSSGSDDDKKRKRKKKKKEKESKKKTEKKLDRLKDEDDDAEAEGQLHPLVSVSNIDPEEIPAGPPNRFLSRGGPSSMFLMKPQKDNDDRLKKRNSIRGVTKSGRIVKGRGTLRFRTPSRSRSRSYTPPHWRQEQKKMITFNEFEKMEIERKEKEEEIKRREEARKKRHEEKEKREKGKNGQTPPGSPPKGSEKQNDKIEIDMMAKIEDVFQIIRDRNIKNGSDNHDNKKADQRLSDIKKKSKGEDRDKFQKMEKKFDRRSRSRSPKRRFNDNFRRDRVPRDGKRYHKDNRYDNKSIQGGQRNRSRDREHFDKKKKNHRRSTSSSSEDRKNKKKIRNENSFSLSPEVKD